MGSPTGPFGIDRPFIEEHSCPLFITYKYPAYIIGGTLEQMTDDLVRGVKQKGYAVDGSDWYSEDPSLIQVQLSVTNLDISSVNNLKDLGKELDGFKGAVISTEHVSQIDRLY